MSTYTPSRDEMIDGYRAMRVPEIGGDPLLASVQALGEAERWFAKHDSDLIERLADSAAINAAGVLGPWDDVVFAWLREQAASLRASDDAGDSRG